MHFNQRNSDQYGLRRGLGFWDLTYEGRQAIFKHEQGALYVACLLLDPPREPLHAVALALKAGNLTGAAEVIQQRNLGLDDAEEVRALRQRERELEALLEDELVSEPVKAEVRHELEEVAEFQRRHPWRSEDCAQKCVRAVAMAIRRFHGHLAKAVDAQGRPHPVLQGFARHLREHLLIPSGRGGGHGGARVAAAPGGCFTYEPPQGVVWNAEPTESNPLRRRDSAARVQRPASANSGSMASAKAGGARNSFRSNPRIAMPPRNKFRAPALAPVFTKALPAESEGLLRK